jgi:hypothetical protein
MVIQGYHQSWQESLLACLYKCASTVIHVRNTFIHDTTNRCRALCGYSARDVKGGAKLLQSSITRPYSLVELS